MLSTVQSYKDSIVDVVENLDRSKQSILEFQKVVGIVINQVNTQINHAKDEFKKNASEVITSLNAIPTLTAYVNDKNNETQPDYADKVKELKELKNKEKMIYNYLERDQKLTRLIKTTSRSLTNIQSNVSKDSNYVLGVYSDLKERLFKLKAKITAVLHNPNQETYTIYKLVLNLQSVVDKLNVTINEYNSYIDRFNTMAIGLKNNNISYYTGKRRHILVDFKDLNDTVAEITKAFTLDPVQIIIDEYFATHDPVQNKIAFVTVDIPDLSFAANYNVPVQSGAAPLGVPGSSGLQVMEVDARDLGSSTLADNVPTADYQTQITATEWRENQELTEGVLMRYLEMVTRTYPVRLKYNIEDTTNFDVFVWNKENKLTMMHKKPGIVEIFSEQRSKIPKIIENFAEDYTTVHEFRYDKMTYLEQAVIAYLIGSKQEDYMRARPAPNALKLIKNSIVSQTLLGLTQTSNRDREDIDFYNVTKSHSKRRRKN